jgi:hypothetical protein
MFHNREHFKEIDPIYTLGSLDALTGNMADKWVKKYVYALENS